MIDRLTKLKSQGCQMKESGEEEEDRLSELPIHLKEAILGCLTISDAGKTSVLSSEWRYVWTGLRKLLVYPRFWLGRAEVKYKALTQILLTHNGPIREFYLYLPFIDNLDAFWLLRLSEKGVENVAINGYIRMRGLLSIPSSMFECLELKRLSLSNCTLSPPLEFRGFPNLVSLHLNRVCIESQFLKNLIDKCPLLENLTLKGPFSGIEMPIALNSRSLKTFELMNIYLGSVSFENVPNLTNVSLWGMSGYDRRDLQNRLKAWEFMSSLIGIKELSFEFSMLEMSYKYKCDPFDKNCLRAAIAYLAVEAKEEIKTSITTVSVTFETLCSLWNWEHIEAEIALIESIVSCCPALGKLVIKGSSRVKGYAKQQLSRALRRLGRSSSKLKIVYANAVLF